MTLLKTILKWEKKKKLHSNLEFLITLNENGKGNAFAFTCVCDFVYHDW